MSGVLEQLNEALEYLAEGDAGDAATRREKAKARKAISHLGKAADLLVFASTVVQGRRENQVRRLGEQVEALRSKAEKLLDDKSWEL